MFPLKQPVGIGHHAVRRLLAKYFDLKGVFRLPRIVNVSNIAFASRGSCDGGKDRTKEAQGELGRRLMIKATVYKWTSAHFCGVSPFGKRHLHDEGDGSPSRSGVLEKKESRRTASKAEQDNTQTAKNIHFYDMVTAVAAHVLISSAFQS